MSSSTFLVQFSALTFALILCGRAAPEPFTFSLNFLNTQLPSFSFFNLFLFHHHSNGAAPAADQKFICKLKPRLKSPPSKQVACTNKLFKIETFKSFWDSQICLWPSRQMATNHIKQMFIEAPGLPSKPIKSASPQIRGEILKAEAEFFLQGDNFFNLISSRRHQLLMNKLKNSSREHVTFKGYVCNTTVDKENVQE